MAEVVYLAKYSSKRNMLAIQEYYCRVYKSQLCDLYYEIWQAVFQIRVWWGFVVDYVDSYPSSSVSRAQQVLVPCISHLTLHNNSRYYKMSELSTNFLCLS